jgi:dolichyl-diphosphooligosaccharide--protein glycosyltransferase
MSQARAFVERDGSAQVGGIGALPSERVSALEHYRLVRVSNQSAFSAQSYQRQFLVAQQLTGYQATRMFVTNPSWLKTFERVPGARIEGSGAPPNTEVTAEVEMRAPVGNYTFTYRQHAQSNDDGEFTMVLPYSTTDYDDYGPENGYTNVSVRATGPYTISTPGELVEVDGNASVEQFRTTVNVSEGRVNGDRQGALQVTLERRVEELTFSDVDGDVEPSAGAGTSERSDEPADYPRPFPTATPTEGAAPALTTARAVPAG